MECYSCKLITLKPKSHKFSFCTQRQVGMELIVLGMELIVFTQRKVLMELIELHLDII